LIFKSSKGIVDIYDSNSNTKILSISGSDNNPTVIVGQNDCEMSFLGGRSLLGNTGESKYVIRLETNIRSDGNAFFALHLEGYHYRAGQHVQIFMNGYNYPSINQIINRGFSVIANGHYRYEAKFTHENGVIVIYIKSLDVDLYYFSFNVYNMSKYRYKITDISVGADYSDFDSYNSNSYELTLVEGGQFTKSIIVRGGKVGINTNTPAYGLDVNASARLRRKAYSEDDIEFTDPNKGIILVDRNDGTRYRVYVEYGFLNVEEI
jgi:hypothetical protein